MNENPAKESVFEIVCFSSIPSKRENVEDVEQQQPYVPSAVKLAAMQKLAALPHNYLPKVK